MCKVYINYASQLPKNDNSLYFIKEIITSFEQAFFMMFFCDIEIRWQLPFIGSFFILRRGTLLAYISNKRNE